MRVFAGKILGILFGIAAGWLCSCTADVPADAQLSKDKALIYPDYSRITVPYNIAPLNFYIDMRADRYIVCIEGQDNSRIVIKGPEIKIDPDKWKKLLANNKGKSYTVTVYLLQNGKWKALAPFTNSISDYPVDTYLSYRLIEPGYVRYDRLWLVQRDLTSFKEHVIYNNLQDYKANEMQCINCHSFQNYKTDNMQFHARAYKGGTIIVSNGKPEKINIKTDSLPGAGQYPAWHPTKQLIAYSVNRTRQLFHSIDPQKVEVMDSESDLVLYNIENNHVQIIRNDSDELETYPSWSPDGKWLYYSIAHIKTNGQNAPDFFSEHYKDIKYNINRIPFNGDSLTFGAAQTIVNAASNGKSALLPRISPDGKWLLYSLADYGTFHIWHKSSDLYVKNLDNGNEYELDNANSPDSESYHSWSSNGRWIVFTSRRDDGSYSRLYLAYFSPQGEVSKAFVIPQEKPLHNAFFMKSYNIPEFTVEPVTVSLRQFSKAIRKDAKQAVHESR